MPPESALPEEIWRIIFCEKKLNLVHSVVLWQLCAHFSGILSNILSNCLEKSLRNLLPYLTLNDLLTLRCVSERLKKTVGHVMDSSLFGHDDDTNTEESMEDDDADWKRRFFPLLKLKRNRLGDIPRLLSFMNDYSMKGNLFVGRCVSISVELDCKQDEKDAFVEYLTRFGKHVEVLHMRVAMDSVRRVRTFFLACLNLTEHLRKVVLIPIIVTGSREAARNECKRLELIDRSCAQLNFVEWVAIKTTVYNNEVRMNETASTSTSHDAFFLALFGKQIFNLKKLQMSNILDLLFMKTQRDVFHCLTEMQFILYRFSHDSGFFPYFKLHCPNLRKMTLKFLLPEKNIGIWKVIPVHEGSLSLITHLHILFILEDSPFQTCPVSFKERLPLKKLHTLKLSGAIPTDITGLASNTSLRKIELELTDNPNSLDYLFTKIPSLTSYSLKVSENPKVTRDRDI